MSEFTHGDGERRSWWEEPDPRQEDAPTPDEGGSPRGAHPAPAPGQRPQDQHDPYRASAAAPAAAQGWGAPPQDQQAWQDQQRGAQQAPPQWAAQQPPGPQPYPPNQTYGQPGPAQHGPAQPGPAQYAPGQYAPGQYGPAQYAPGQYAPAQYAPGQYGQHGYGAPVAGQAQAVMWTGIGSLALLVFSAGGLGFIPAIVSLVMAPGARRQVLESQGRLQGLGQIRTGQICAWVTLGLTLLAVLAVVVLVVVLRAAIPDTGSDFDLSATGLGTAPGTASGTGAPAVG
ncbi:hypothetical protein [Kineococcus glutinatus]|uniref:DUF4190 domain-containing protein n=1 Tax=Kineococcus glutinatus TaxID=1070872 RepID=A0ABP9IAB9_9ACTN